MKQIIIALTLLCSISKAQKIDTIFTKENKVIPCKITLINNANIFYNDGDFISLDRVNFYSQNGTRSNRLNITQHEIKKSVEKSAEVQNIKPATDTIDIHQELFFIKQCLNNHYQQKMTGIGIYFGGLGVSVLGGVLAGTMDDTSTGIGISIAGGVMAIIGSIVVIDSNKWFKKASLGVNGTGAFVKYKF